MRLKDLRIFLGSWLLLGVALAQQPSGLRKPTYGDVSYGPYGERNLLDFWKADSETPTPVLVSIHGGGFLGGNKTIEFQPLLELCLKS
ncbi:MAG: hypothetical protein JNM63_14220, partial [Spirochaetia bacterium]|nr:hypothetical protein [Spirochaetia bacterium]